MNYLVGAWQVGYLYMINGFDSRKFRFKLENYELFSMIGKNSPKPKLSKRYELYHDLKTRIRESWDRNITVEIIFKN